jgi:hypothetical protein
MVTGCWQLASGSTASASNLNSIPNEILAGYSGLNFSGQHVQPSQPPVASRQPHYLNYYF